MNNNLSEYDNEALYMLRHIGIPDALSVSVLSDDIRAVAEELNNDELLAHEGRMELTRRIGGINNLKSYMACLMVGKS